MNLTHHFLVSMPQMLDTCFHNSVVYLLDHSEQGAFGVIVNDALDMDFKSLLAQLDIALSSQSSEDVIVLRGGPVDESHGLVLHEPGPQFNATKDFDHGVSLSSSKDVLEAIAAGEEPSRFLLVLGHAGLAPGQLEMEIADNAWLTCLADNDVLFNTPITQRREAVGNLIGVNLSHVVGHSGHA